MRWPESTFHDTLRAAAVLFVGCGLVAGCVAPSADSAGRGAAEKPEVALPSYAGPKIAAAVLPLGLSREAAERYPKLRELAVGLGVHNILVDTLYDAKCFTLVESREDVLQEILKRQWADAAGLLSQDSAIERGKLTGARYILYGEVYDFGVSSRGESVGLVRRRTDTIHVGVQIRMVSVESGEFVPASGMGQSGLTTERLVFAEESTRFAGTDVGSATRQAVRRAVAELMKRLPEPP